MPRSFQNLASADRSHMNSRRNAVFQAAFLHQFDGLDHLRMIEFTRHAQRNGEIRGSDHDRVDARNGEQLIAAFDRQFRLDLQDHHGIRVLMFDDLRDGGLCVVDVARRQVRSRARPWEETSSRKWRAPAVQDLPRAEKSTPCAPLSRARATREYCKSATRTIGIRPAVTDGAANILQCFQIERTVFGVDIRPVEAGGGKNPAHFGRTQLAETTSGLEFALLEGVLHGVDVHPLNLTALVGIRSSL